MNIYSNLSAEMSRLKLTTPKLADGTGININTLYPKINGVRDFKLSEMRLIQDYLTKLANERELDLDLSLEYLFKKDSILKK